MVQIYFDFFSITVGSGSGSDKSPTGSESLVSASTRLIRRFCGQPGAPSNRSNRRPENKGKKGLRKKSRIRVFGSNLVF